MRSWIFVHVPKAAGTSIRASFHPNGCAFQPTEKHASAVEIQAQAPALWHGAFTFAVIRNPWDRALSAWAYQRDHVGAPEFADWLSHSRPLRSQWDMVSDGSVVLVDYLIRFEQLDLGLMNVCGRLGVEAPAQTPHFNASRSRGAAWRRHFCPWMVDLVRAQYPEDVYRFQYRFHR